MTFLNKDGSITDSPEGKSLASVVAKLSNVWITEWNFPSISQVVKKALNPDNIEGLNFSKLDELLVTLVERYNSKDVLHDFVTKLVNDYGLFELVKLDDRNKKDNEELKNPFKDPANIPLPKTSTSIVDLGAESLDLTRPNNIDIYRQIRF